MPISWRRYKGSDEMFGRFNIEFRLSAYELLDIVGKYFNQHTDDDPDPSKREVEKFIRDELHYGGTNFWTWRDGLDEEEYAVDMEQARDLLCELWPNLAKDFHKVEL